MQNPAPINELVAKEAVHNQGTNWFLIRWQTNAYVIRRSTRPDTLDKPFVESLDGEIVGRWQNQYWSIENDSLLGHKLTLWTNLDDSNEPDNRVTVLHDACKTRVSDILNMGVPALNIASVHWTDSSFKYQATGFGQALNGVLRTNVTGQVSEIAVHRFLINRNAKATGALTDLITYTYSNPELPNWLPSTAARVLIRANKANPTPICTITYLRYVASTGNAQDYKPARYLEDMGLPTLTVVGDKTYYRVGTHTGTVLSANAPETLQLQKRRGIRVGYIVSAALFLVAVAVAAARAATKQNPASKEKLTV